MSNQTNTQPFSKQPPQPTADTPPSPSDKVAPSPSQKTKTKTHKKTPFNWNKYLPWIAGILTGILITQLLLVQILSNNLIKQLTESATFNQQNQEQRIAKYELSQNQDKIDLIEKAYPDENGIVQLIRQIEDQLNPFEDVVVTINQDNPIITSKQTLPMLPISISVSATPSAYLNFIKDLQNEPYLLQPIKLEYISPDGIDNLSKINYQANVFISPKLVKP